MRKLKYKPIWPEVLVWWGAGASKNLNLLTTDDIAKQVSILAKDIAIDDRLNLIYEEESEGARKELNELLHFFEGSEDDIEIL